MKTPSSTPRTFAFLVFVAVSVFDLHHSTCSAQGSLSPPGAPAPTMKTLDEVEARTPVDANNTPGNASTEFAIVSPGSYYLTANVDVTKATGIVINSEGVTLDLNGFEVRRVAGSDGDGIQINANRCALRNGIVRDFENGIDGPFATRLRLADLTITSMSSNGIVTSAQAHIENCLVQEVGGIGISAGIVSEVRNCSVWTSGSHGIKAAETSIIENNVANNCQGDSIIADNRCTIRNNVCDFPPASGAGIHLTSNQGESRIENNNITRRAVGLLIDGPDNYVSGNTVRQNGDNYDFAPGNFLNLLLCQIPESIDWPATVKLAGTLRGSSGSGGITVQADHVTIDLGGHALIGGPGSTRAITAPGLQFQLTIHGGSIRDWGADGIDVANVIGGLVEEVHAISNGWSSGNGVGIRTSSGWDIKNCSAIFNKDTGIDAGSGVVTECVASGNGGDGFAIFSTGTANNCRATSNGGDGINAGSGTTLKSCTTVGNTGDGIQVTHGGSVVNCSATDNDGDGIVALYGCTVTDSAAKQNDGTGIRGEWDCTVKNCSATDNRDDGIRMRWRSLIKDCTASSNDGDGIEVLSDCQVRDNVCSNNGPDAADGAGIHATSDSNHIEGNSVTVNDRGIDVDSFINLVIRNSARGNGTNYSIVPGNAVGPMVSSGTIGANNNPHANYDYNL